MTQGSRDWGREAGVREGGRPRECGNDKEEGTRSSGRKPVHLHQSMALGHPAPLHPLLCPTHSRHGAELHAYF